MNAIEILRAASRSVPNEDYVQFMAAVEAIAELIDAASAAEFHLTREHRAPTTVDAADYLTEVERDRNRIRAAIAKAKGESDGR